MITAVEAAINEAMIRRKGKKKKKKTLYQWEGFQHVKKEFMINWFLPWYSKRRNSSIKFQFWYEISPTQNRQDCTNALSGAVRMWGSSDAIQAGTTALRCHRGRNRFSARWQTCGSQQRCNGSTAAGLAFVSQTEQTAKKSALSPNKTWNVCNKRHHLCLCLSPATIMYSSESSKRGGGWAWDSEKVEMRKVPTWSLQNEWIITGLYWWTSASLSPLLWNNCVW